MIRASAQADNHAVVMRALLAVKDDQIGKVVGGLDDEELDTLMKYIYRGLSDGENSGVLFKWHAQTLAASGMSSIVRALTDRKTV